MEKYPGDTPQKDTALYDMDYAVFYGTNVVSGKAGALVVGTNGNTEFGRMAKRKKGSVILSTWNPPVKERPGLRTRAAADRVACEARRTERDLLSVVVTEAGNGLAEGDFGGQARLFQSAARAAVLLGWAGVRYGKESYCAQVRVVGNQAGPLGF